MARQQHGFNYENYIIHKYGLVKEKNKTGRFDAYYNDGEISIPVQIKTVKKRAQLCLGSYLRNREIHHDFILIIGIYDNDPTIIVDEQTFNVSAKLWRDLCDYKYHHQMMEEFALQTNLREDDGKWKQFIKKHKDQWNAEKFRIMNLAPKRDSKTQLRIQLAVSQSKRSKLFDILMKFELKEVVPDLNIEMSHASNAYAKKSKLDKFYTKSAIADRLISITQYIIGREELQKIKIVLEPSAGSGNFSKQISNYLMLADMRVLAYDIEPGDDCITKLDFLETDISADINASTIVIGNPPFGKQCSGAINFFNKCASYPNVQYIAFILPPTFRKSSIQDRLDLDFSLQQDITLNKDAFMLVEGTKIKDYDVPSIFQVWKRERTKRSKSIKNSVNEHYHFCPSIKDAQFAFRRVGVNAGKTMIIKDGSDYSKQSHYFITTSIDANIVCDRLNQIEWPSNNTVGPRSISKNDLIYELNSITQDLYPD